MDRASLGTRVDTMGTFYLLYQFIILIIYEVLQKTACFSGLCGKLYVNDIDVVKTDQDHQSSYRGDLLDATGEHFEQLVSQLLYYCPTSVHMCFFSPLL